MKPSLNKTARLKNTLGACLLVATLGLFSTGCAEQHYYHRYHHHTRDWYGRRHQAPPPGVNFDVDVR